MRVYSAIYSIFVVPFIDVSIVVIGPSPAGEVPRGVGFDVGGQIHNSVQILFVRHILLFLDTGAEVRSLLFIVYYYFSSVSGYLIKTTSRCFKFGLRAIFTQFKFKDRPDVDENQMTLNYLYFGNFLFFLLF